MPTDPDLPTPLLGGLSPSAFMRRHWQKKPLCIRQAVPGGIGWAGRTRLLALARNDEVESRLIVRRANGWTMRPGPIGRSAVPPLAQPGWTLLVQGVDLHWPEARALLDRFRFVPDARLDDLMISFATDGGGVGPHLDSYDVFLLQAWGRRRWRIGPVPRPHAFVPDVPLKLLARFEPTDEWLLDAGDMLYLPPGWGHDGVAEGACATCSIGFRAPARGELAGEVLQRIADAAGGDAGRLYRDAGQPATAAPAHVPPSLQRFAAEAVDRWVRDPEALGCALGEWLSEPKPGVRFEAASVSGSDPRIDLPGARRGSAGVAAVVDRGGALRLDRRSRMMYDEVFVFVNGEAFRCGGRDAPVLRRLADARALSAAERGRLSAPARRVLAEWIDAGWVHPVVDGDIGEGDGHES